MVQMLTTKAAFDSALAKAGSTLVVVDFTASWCGPCRMVAPKYEELAKKLGDAVQLFKVDVDENEETAQACGISCMPTFQFYKNCSKIDQIEGADIAKVAKKIEEYK